MTMILLHAPHPARCCLPELTLFGATPSPSPYDASPPRPPCAWIRRTCAFPGPARADT